MIQKIESNDIGFTGMWSNAIKLDYGILFINQNLSDDIFFDKLAGITCVNEGMIDKAMEYFQKNNSMPCVYSLNNPELDYLLEKKGFRRYDVQHVLKRIQSATKTNAMKITHDDIDLWTEIFCHAYDCLDWKDTVISILKNTLDSIDYIVDESGSSCMALYEKNSILGLYCLGTVPSKRHNGTAASLIDFASYYANSKNLTLILETYEKDNLLEFYSKLGFEKVYHKIVYTI
jgi:GNAT superfamily N-acetyltransferase